MAAVREPAFGARARPDAVSERDPDAPPLLSWRALYAVVIGALALAIAALSWLTEAFR